MDLHAGIRRRLQRCKFFAQAVEDLCAYAEPVFRAGRRVDDGATEGDHAASAAAQFAKLGLKSQAAKVTPDFPPFPWTLDYLWMLFMDFSIGLTSNGMAPVQASWRDIQDWCAAMLLDLEPWEKRTLIRLANLRAYIQSEEKPKTAT